MKIKGSVKKLDAGKLFLVFGILGAVFCALRLYQTLAIIDPSTGFFTDKANFTVGLFYGFALCLALAAPLLFYLAPLPGAERIRMKKDLIHGGASILFSLSLLFSAADAFSQIRLKSAEPDSFSGLPSGLGGAKLPIAVFVTAILAMIVLLLEGVCFLTGRDGFRKLKICHLFPSLWALFSTINYFTITVSYLNNTSLLIAIFGSVFLMIFLYEYARKLTGISGDLNSPSFFATGVLAAVFLLATTVCTIPGLLSPARELLYCDFALYRLTAGLFVISAMRIVYGNSVPADAPSAENAECGMQNEE